MVTGESGSGVFAVSLTFNGSNRTAGTTPMNDYAFIGGTYVAHASGLISIFDNAQASNDMNPDYYVVPTSSNTHANASSSSDEYADAERPTFLVRNRQTSGNPPTNDSWLLVFRFPISSTTGNNATQSFLYSQNSTDVTFKTSTNIELKFKRVDDARFVTTNYTVANTQKTREKEQRSRCRSMSLYDLRHRLLQADTKRLHHRNTPHTGGDRYAIVLFNKNLNYKGTRLCVRSCAILEEAPLLSPRYLPTRTGTEIDAARADLLWALERTPIPPDWCADGAEGNSKYEGKVRLLSFGISQPRKSRWERAAQGLLGWATPPSSTTTCTPT